MRAGATLPRSAIEKAVAGRAKDAERDYRVVWNIGEGAAGTFADRGQTFKAALLAGGRLDVSTLLGSKPIVLTFWASWCAPCRLEAPHLAALYRRYAAKGVAFVAVSIDEADDYDALRAIVADLKLPYPVALDPRGEVLAKYAKGASIPLTFVIDRAGAVTWRHQNFEPGDEADIDKAIRAVLE